MASSRRRKGSLVDAREDVDEVLFDHELCKGMVYCICGNCRSNLSDKYMYPFVHRTVKSVSAHTPCVSICTRSKRGHAGAETYCSSTERFHGFQGKRCAESRANPAKACTRPRNPCWPGKELLSYGPGHLWASKSAEEALYRDKATASEKF